MTAASDTKTTDTTTSAAGAASAVTISDAERYKGYRGPGRETLARWSCGVWSRVELESTRGRFEGLILPRSETADDEHIVLKLDIGYNIGVAASSITSMRELGRKEAHYQIPEKAFPYDEGKPNVILLGTGGTIASRLDYRTGAVIPAFSPGELYGSVPELADICNLRTEKLFGVFSENMGPEQYIALANRIGEVIREGVDGIVIGHGTDTMHHTASVLSFMAQNTPVPIVMVGSQRSSDRPSSDAALNLIHAVKTAAESDIAEVLVCMFGPTSDEYGLLHRGVRVRKMHSSYRSTFRTIGDIPVAMVNRDCITPLREDYRRRRRDRDVIITPTFDERVTIVYYYPNMQPDIIDALVEKGYRGIVIAGTGLGHVNKPLYPALKRAAEAGVHIYMTVQTLWGYTQMYVYETGREIMGLGVNPVANMLPEVAFMKLSWALGQTHDHDEVRTLMQTPITDETTDREPYNGYLIYQGGIPEVQEFLRHIMR
ncbi:MAG: Glu-tRNA(Gln) amidotransferase subunit GatD [Planctomycetota bacterium]